MSIEVGEFDPETGGIKKKKFEDTGSCLDCEFKKIEEDPDPTDWFRDTDVKVWCQKLGRYVHRNVEPFDSTRRPNDCPRVQQQNLVRESEKVL